MSKPDEQKFKVVYEIHRYPEGISKSDLIEKYEDGKREFGACDQLIIHSVILTPSGDRSELIYGFDGDRAYSPMPSNELFKSWAMTAYDLSKRSDLGTGKRELAAEAFNVIQEALLMAHGECSDPNCVCRKKGDGESKAN